MLTDFYVAFATVCFTLLGLWIIVARTRHAEWRHRPVHRRRAYGVALHFSLPGLMSLLSLVDPASTTLWRVSSRSWPLVASLPWCWTRTRPIGLRAAASPGPTITPAPLGSMPGPPLRGQLRRLDHRPSCSTIPGSRSPQ